jgi:hypothetical protein
MPKPKLENLLNTVKELMAGKVIDIVGVSAGLDGDYPATLVFTGCIFLPAGSVA